MGPRRWVRNAMMWGMGMASAVGGMLLVFYTHENAPWLELTGIFILLGLALALGLLAWHVRRIRALAGWSAVGFLILSMFFAIAHGWALEVRAIYALASIIFVVGTFWLSARVWRLRFPTFPSMLLGTGEPTEAAILADTRPPMVIYPARGKLARALAIQAAFLAGLGVAGPWLFSQVFSEPKYAAGSVLYLLLAALFAFFVVMEAWRLARPRPALIITSNGLIDNISGIATGAGPIWWREVAHVGIYARRKRLGITHRYLIVVPLDRAAVWKRQGFAKGLLLRLTNPIPGSGPIHLYESLLPLPLEKVLEAITSATDQFTSEDGVDSASRDE